MSESKTALRSALLSQRSSLATATAECWSRSIQARLLETPLYRSANVVALYSSVQNEAATEKIRDHSLRDGKRVVYTRLLSNRRVEFVEIEYANEFVSGK